MKLWGSTVVVTGASRGSAPRRPRSRPRGSPHRSGGARARGLDRQVATLKATVATHWPSRPICRPRPGSPSWASGSANAGPRLTGQQRRMRPIHLSASLREPNELLATAQLSCLAAMLLTLELLPSMLERGSGRIVNVNSLVSRLSWSGAAGYLASGYAMRPDRRLRQAWPAPEVIPGKGSSDLFANNAAPRTEAPDWPG